MPATVNIGTLEGLLQWKADDADLQRSLADVAKKADISRSQLNSYNKELAGVDAAYKRVIASIDPAAAATQKYEQAHTALSNAFKSGRIGIGQYSDDLEKLVSKYQPAQQNTSGLSSLISKLTEVTGLFGPKAEEMASGLESISAKGAGIGETLSGLGAALPAILAIAAGIALFAVGFEAVKVGIDILADITKEGLKTQAIISELNQSLKSNGAYAGYTGSQLVAMADDMSEASGKSKDLILQGLTIETRFDKLSHDTFPQFAKAALDLGQKTGDIPGSFQKISVAAEGGGKGLMVLKDIGVVLTTQQKAMMKQLSDTGQTAEYQRIVLGLLQQHIGGLADAYANTLEGSMKRARNEFTLGREIIAGQIIPAITAAFNGLIKWAGGWDQIKYVIQYVSLSIGEFIHDFIFKSLIYFDQFMIAWGKTGINIDTVAMEVEGAFFNLAASILQSLNAATHSSVFDGLITSLKNLKAQAEAQTKININIDSKTVIDFTTDLIKNTASLHDHTSALAGDTDLQAKHAKVLDDIPPKQKKVNDGIEAEIKAYNAMIAAYTAQALKMNEEINDRARLLIALGLGDNAYKLELASITAEKQLRTDLASLLKSHETAVQAANKAIEESTKGYGVNSDKVNEAKRILSDLNDTYAGEIQKLKEESAANILSADALEKKKIAVAETAKEITAYGKVVLEQLKETEAFKQQLATATATFTDSQTYQNFALQYGKVIADLAVQYGYLTDATKANKIETLAQAEAHKQAAAGMVVDIDVIRAKIKEQQEALDEWKTTASADIWQPLSDSFQTANTTILDGMRQWIETGQFSASSIAASLEDTLLKAFQKILQDWINLQITMAAVEKARITEDAAFGDVVGGSSSTLSSGGSVVSSGASAAGGTSAYSGLGSSFSAWGSLASYAFLAWVGIEIFKGWTATRTSWGEASIGGALNGDIALGQQAQAAIIALTTQVTDLAKSWHLGLVGLTAGSVTISESSTGAIVVKTALDSAGKVFKDIASAMEYAKVEALKFATFSSDTSAIIVAAIQQSAAVNTAGLQSDIDFATKLATQNMPAIASSMHTALQTMTDDFQHVMDLFGPDQFLGFTRNLGTFMQLGPATASVLTAFNASIQALYDQLTGHKEDARQLAEQQRVAFNAQRAIEIAQIQLLYAQIAAEIAKYQTDIAVGKHPGPGIITGDPNTNNTGRTGTGSNAKDSSGPQGDPRNPGNDPQLAALLQVLDNLARALQGLPPEIKPGGVKIPRGTGTGRADKLTVKEAIESSNLKLAGDQYLISLDAINKQWDDMAKKAHHNKQLLAEITAQREKETAALQAALALKVKTDIASYASQGDNSEAAQQAANIKQAADLIKEAVQAGADLHQSADVIAANLALIDAAEKKHAWQIAQSAIASLGLPIETTWEGIQKLADTLAGLNQDVKDGTITVAQFNSVWAQQINQSNLSLLGLAQTIAQSAGDATKAAEIKAKMDQINFGIQVLQFNILLTQYETLGLISGQMKADDEALRTWINAQHPDFAVLNAAAKTQSSAATTQTTAANTMLTAVQSLIAYETTLETDSSLGLVDPRTALNNSKANYEADRAKALTGDSTAISAFQGFAETYRKNLIAFSPSSELTASVLSGIEDTIDRIKLLPGVQAVLTPDGTAIVQNLNQVASGVGILNTTLTAVNDNTKRLTVTADQMPSAIADAANDKQAAWMASTLTAQQASADALQSVRDDMKTLASNVLAWRTESRGNVDEAYGQMKDANDKLAVIASNTRQPRPLAGTGG